MRALSVVLFAVLTGCNGSDPKDSTAGTDTAGEGLREDADGDGYTVDEGDCDDTDPAVNPGAEEIPYNGVSDDCRPSTPDDDLDGDGYGIEEDCDDLDPDRSPDANEVCDGLDNDCDGAVDDSVGDVWYTDADGDTYGDGGAPVKLCDGQSGYVDNADDCDDTRADVSPGGEEVCDEADNDCDGTVDEGVQPVWYFDFDGDGYGSPELALEDYACTQPTGFVGNDGDCDDSDASISPDGQEVCDDADTDEDCDGAADDDDDSAIGQEAWYGDGDGDGYSGADVLLQACDQQRGYSAEITDCDDSDASINPGAEEVCDDADTDEDCDGLADDDDSSVGGLLGWYTDSDGDGYGDEGSIVEACSAPSGALAVGGDCDDSDSGVNPGEAEVCGDGVDNDCDGGFNACGVSGTVDLWAADGQVDSASSGALLGRAIAAAGDVNGDGRGDLFVSAYSNDDEDTDAGAVYLMYGPLTSGEDSDDAAAVRHGEASEDYAGRPVDAGADVDGDGTGDYLVSAYGDDTAASNAGAVYVLYGPLSGESGLDEADAKLLGERASDQAGYAIALLGDINSDGYDDIVVGAPYGDAGGTSTGSVYLVLGPVSGELDLGGADGELVGDDSYDYAGHAVADAGDLDGDGAPELIVGAYGDDAGASNAGAAYIVSGGFSSTGYLSATADARLAGESSSDYAGHRVAGAGDVDGDGYGDVLVGAYGEDSGGSAAGAAYLVRGPITSNQSLSSAEAQLVGESSGDYAGYAISAAGDVDADGSGDVLVGAYANDENGSGAGAAYLMYGPFSGEIDLGDADAKLYGERSGDYAGLEVSDAGDLNADGFGDVAIGAPYDDSSGSSSGTMYLLLGSGL